MSWVQLTRSGIMDLLFKSDLLLFGLDRCGLCSLHGGLLFLLGRRLRPNDDRPVVRITRRQQFVL